MSSGTEFGTIIIDPPWPERGAGKVKRGADRHYSLLSTHDIPRVIGSSPAFRPADDSHLWVWTTNNYLPHAVALFPLLGFRYVTNLAWVKMAELELSVVPVPTYLIGLASGMLQIGLGQYFRGAHELLLFGVRGRAMVPPPANRLPSVVVAPRGRHSAKPAEFYERVELVSPPPRLEMFARSLRDGWTSWGNEVQ